MLTLYDEFAGWGGSSQGCTAVPGVQLTLAANHAPIAVDVHALNFPDADHYLGDVTKADIETFPRADLFWASPACPPFSNARGEKQYFDQATQAALFDDPDETPEERERRLSLVKRRALMEEVPRYLRAGTMKNSGDSIPI
jgi:DNA (cytosine-5)-methyltransferase 1